MRMLTYEKDVDDWALKKTCCVGEANKVHIKVLEFLRVFLL